MFYVLMVNNHAKLKQIQRHVDLKHSIHGMLTTEPTIYHHQAGGKQQQLVAGLPDFFSLSMQRVTTTLHSAFPPALLHHKHSPLRFVCLMVTRK